MKGCMHECQARSWPMVISNLKSLLETGDVALVYHRGRGDQPWQRWFWNYSMRLPDKAFHGSLIEQEWRKLKVKGNFPRSLFWCFCLAALSGCGLATTKMYEGPEKPAVEQAVVSSMGIYQERSLRLWVVAISGKVVDGTRTAEFLVLPGQYRMTLKIEKDLTLGPARIDWKETEILVSLDAVAGHTYIPNARVDGRSVAVYFDDAGVGFNRECLPLRRFAVAYGGSADGRKAGC